MFRFFRMNRSGKFASFLLSSALAGGTALAGDTLVMPAAADAPAVKPLPPLDKDPPVKLVPAVEAVLPAEAPPVVVEGCPGGGAPRKFPPITPLPRPGNPTITPTGPGYYSLCDELKGDFSEKPPKYPYPRFSIIPHHFFDIDWSYLDDPKNTETDYFDCLKRIQVTDNIKFTTGGEFRFRYNNEVDSRLSGRNNTYELYRTRVYGDLTIGDRVRLFVEGIDARTGREDLAPLPIDVNRTDLQNLFLEFRTIDIGDDPLYVRIGRQELLYGSQRLISALDWANTRRTFQGAKAYWHSEKLDVDAFCVQPVAVSPSHFDSVDNNQIFAGLWTKFKPSKGHTLDAYYLFLDNTNVGPAQPPQVPAAQRILRGPYNVHTLGGRYYGEEENGLMYGAEAAIQLGDKRDQSILASMATGGVGYNAKDLCWTPQLWLYYDYASGDQTPNSPNGVHTFNQLFPFGHYYFGFIDVVGRQNIHDLNAQFVVYPKKWLLGLVQYHVFHLDKERDALYNAGGNAIRRDATGRAGDNVGQELDLVANIHIDKHSDIFLNYSHLFIGDFIRGTNPAGNRSPDYFFLQYSYRW